MDKTISYYEEHAGEYVENTKWVDFRAIQERFLSALRSAFPELSAKELRILDFGCGSGRDTKYFLELGYTASALDGSAELCKSASEYTGIPVRQLYFEDFRDIAC